MNEDTVSERAAIAALAALQQRHWPAGLPRQPSYPHGEIALTEMLRAWARRQPDAPLLHWYGRTVTFAELDAASDRCAALLHAHGVRAGDRVGVMLANCPQFHVAFYGILKAGAVHVPVNPMFRAAELRHELTDAGVQTLLLQDTLAELVRSVEPQTALRTLFVTSQAELLPAQPTLPVPPALQAPKRVPPGMVDFVPALDACTAPPPAHPAELDAVAALNYTGGTTGLPKGCVHTQRDMVYTAAASCTVAGQLTPADVSLNYMALFWIAGENAGLIYPVFSGSSVVLLARWDPLAAMAAIERHRVTRAGFVLDNAVEIMEHPRVGEFDLRSLRSTRVSSFVKKLNVDYRRRWRALTGTTMIESAWGMTETHTSDTFTTGMQDDDLDLAGQPVFVGLPVPGTTIVIRDFDTGRLLPIGREGEIVVSTPSLLKGYWRQPEASAEALRDGWLRTGDIGVLDERGHLHFLGRRKEMLKVNGMSVFPAEIEALLGRHPDVIGSGVVGADDERVGQRPVAFVRRRPGSRLSESELAAWCREQMAVYKVPEVRFVDELPMTATGKVKKHELQALMGTMR